MSVDKLLTEIERQQKYLDELPAQFSFPLFNSRKALESQRQSGYRNTASAAREIVDNAIEAQATRVHVVFDRPKDRKPHQRKNTVLSVAFVDNGSGMLPTMARYALSWGGGTHFDDPDFIGKFGFGLPNASINQTRRVEVYTRVKGATSITKAWLDINDYAGNSAIQEVPEPVDAELPEFVQAYLDRNKMKFEHGTVVVWVHPDKLTYATDATLKELLLDDFGATYRYLLKDFELVVEGKLVERVDPMFLDAEARYYRRPEEGGAQRIHDAPIAVKYVKDPETKENELQKVTKPEDLDDPNIVAAGSIHVRVVRFPLGLVVGGKADKVPALDEFSRARFEIRKSRRGMSFVRAGREIETVDAFPRRASDISSGLGEWPLLQGYAYHWGIEVSFSPSLDSVFGITNDKQTVRPIEDFWRLLAQEEVDQLLNREQRYQEAERKKARTVQATATLVQDGALPSLAEAAAQAADVAVGDTPVVPDRDRPEANLNFEQKAQESAQTSGKSIDEARAALRVMEKIKSYGVDYIDDEHGPFYTPKWVGKQVVVQINKKHPFFTTLYSSLLTLEGGLLAKEAIDVLLLALGREELRTKNETTADFYREQRTQRWSPFLATALASLSRSIPDGEEDEQAA